MVGLTGNGNKKQGPSTVIYPLLGQKKCERDGDMHAYHFNTPPSVYTLFAYTVLVNGPI